MRIGLTVADQMRKFCRTLQKSVGQGDYDWTYNVPDLPRASITNKAGLVKAIAVISNSSTREIVLRLEEAPRSRVTSSDPLHRFILLSFADFHLRLPKDDAQITEPATARDSTNYVIRLLRKGIVLNGVQYHFYGHSNSQLKSRTCFLFADSRANIHQKVEAFGDFSNIKTVEKKAKRIGLLFSTAVAAIQLHPDRYEDIPDIQTKDYIFTDGCGLISTFLANQLVKSLKIAFRNVRYTPSVYQIRYRGYKGVLSLEPTMKGKTLVKFRDSMRKFRGGDDLTLSVVEHSKVSLN
jgi:regulator of nonsense transcripts 1